MKIIEAINEADRLKPNMYGLPDKIKWLSRLDKRIFEQVYLTHVLSAEEMAPFLPENEEETEPEVIPGLPSAQQGAEWALDLPGHPHGPRPIHLVFEGYNETDQDKELLVGEPYDEMYVHWLETQIDWNNMEYDGFNNSNAVFSSVYGDFYRSFNRTHMPLGGRKIYY